MSNESSKARPNVRARFWFQAAFGMIFTALLILTIAVPDLVEEVFRVNPDGGNGALEWFIVAVCGVAAVVSVGLARAEWRRAPRPPSVMATD